jgi:hypothetical protein
MEIVYAKILHPSILKVILTVESDGSRESVKYRSGDPILGKNFFFPVSSCQSTRTPSIPPEYQHVSLVNFTHRCCKKIERREGKKKKRKKKKEEDGDEKGKA